MLVGCWDGILSLKYFGKIKTFPTACANDNMHNDQVLEQWLLDGVNIIGYTAAYANALIILIWLYSQIIYHG